MAYGVLSRGLLSGTLTGKFEANDFRAHAPRFTGENFEANQKRIAVLQELANTKNCTPSQLAIAWALHQGNDILPMIGTKKRSRLQENLNALTIQLSEPELKQLNEAFPEGAFEGERYAEQQMGIVVK